MAVMSRGTSDSLSLLLPVLLRRERREAESRPRRKLKPLLNMAMALMCCASSVDATSGVKLLSLFCKIYQNEHEI